MSQSASSIIKPSASGTTILKEEAGGTALTVDAAGDVQLANSLTAGKIGSSVVVPQATTKRIHRYVLKNSQPEPQLGNQSNSAGNALLFGYFKPVSHLNSFWIECSIPVQGTGQDQSCCGLLFARHGGGSDVTTYGKGYMYHDVNDPVSSMTTMSQYCGIAASTFGSGDGYNIYWREVTASSNPGRYMPDNHLHNRINTQSQASLVIYEYKNYQ